MTERTATALLRNPDEGRLPVEDSLFDRLRAEHPALPVMAVTKSTLVATSHLIETLVYEHVERCALVSGFQHGRYWAVERDRYLELAGDNDVIAVFAGMEPPMSAEVDHVKLRLRTGDPLAQEWFVLALGPGLAITLCGLDADAHEARRSPVLEADRLFDVVWSGDPGVAAVAAQVVVDAVRRTAPERGDEVAARLAEASRRPPTAAEVARSADALMAGMVQRLEMMRLRELQVLGDANQQKTEFLSRMSHELRTPLNAILGFGQLLDLDDRDADSQDAVDQILTAGRHLASLIDETLDIGRIEAGQLNLDLQVVPLGPLVRGVLALMAPLAAERSLVVSDQVDGDGLAVWADEGRLRQVLLNLLSNAVKYNAEGGRIEVTASRSLDAVRLAVRDTGPGLATGDVERLFTPFERLDAARRGIPGTGLGLVVARSLTEAMDGRLEADSRPGVGTTFIVALPAAP